MITHPPELDAALGALAWAPFTLVEVAAPGSDTWTPLDATDGTLTHSGRSWPRTELSLSLPTAVTPELTAAPVSAYGGRIRVTTGATIRGQSYAFQAAVLDVAETVIARPDGLITVRAVSQEARVNEDRYDTPTPTAAGTVSSVVTGIVRRTLGAAWPVTNNLTADPGLAAGAFTLDGDVWGTVVQIMAAAGGEAIFTSTGALLLRTIPTTGTAPVATLAVGPGGIVTGYESRRRWAYNAVSLRYESSAGTSIVGRWSDTNPASPTRVGGPYGTHRRVDTIAVTALPTQAAADTAAAAVGRSVAAPFRVVDVESIPVPWLTPGDVVTLDLLGGLSERHLLDAVTWPLSQLDPARYTTTDTAPAGA